MKIQLKISLTLFALGLLGVFSFLFTSIPLDIFPEEALKDIPLEALPFLMLVNPILFLIITLLIGHFLTTKVQLQAPLITQLLLKQNASETFFQQLKYGTLLGAVGGILITLIARLSEPLLSQEFLDITNKFSPSPITRFFYGGITEEILLRWGFMTLFIWIAWKIFSRKEAVPKPLQYWAGIFLSAVLFGVGHLPAVFFLLKEPSTFLISYVIVANSIFGIIAGWLFWKKGIEAAMLAHMMVHAIFMASELFK